MPMPTLTPTGTPTPRPTPTPYPEAAGVWIEREKEARQEYARVWMTLPEAKRLQLHEDEINFDVTIRRFAPPEMIRAIRNRIEYFKKMGAH
jgi:hypothetical protein